MGDYLPFGAPTFRLLDYSGSKWRASTPDEQAETIEELFDYYRNTHGFPYPDLSTKKVRSELGRLRKRSAIVTDDREIVWDNTANNLCAHYFPHIWTVPCANARNTAWSAFHNDAHLREAIRVALLMKERVTPHEIISAFSLGTNAGVRVVSRFKPMAAKAIWQRYAPSGGVVYDYACGWGGRMLGALSSDLGLRYVGVDPEPRTHACLKALGDVLVDVYKCRPPEVHMVGSEDFCPADLQGQVDVSFSSPPYFDLEQYSDDDTQSHVKYPTIDGWVDGYLRGTFRNIHTLLKPGGILGLNLTDYKSTKIVDRALEAIRAEGFVEVEVLKMMMVQRRGTGHGNEPYKHEPIYIFRKT